MAVVFHSMEVVGLTKRKHLKLFINQIFLNEGKTLQSLNIIFCSDEYLLAMNKQHLNHHFYTDIITFDLSESKSTSIVAELYISIERVKDNSKSLKVNFLNELHRVMFHGALHLCGFKDKRISDVKLMREKEDEYLKKYFNQ